MYMHHTPSSQPHVDLGSTVFENPQHHDWDELQGTMEYTETWLYDIRDKLQGAGHDAADRLKELAKTFAALRGQADLMVASSAHLSSNRKYAMERQLDLLFADMVVVVKEAEAISEQHFGPIRKDWPAYDMAA